MDIFPFHIFMAYPQDPEWINKYLWIAPISIMVVSHAAWWGGPRLPHPDRKWMEKGPLLCSSLWELQKHLTSVETPPPDMTFLMSSGHYIGCPFTMEYNLHLSLLAKKCLAVLHLLTSLFSNITDLLSPLPRSVDVCPIITKGRWVPLSIGTKVMDD